MIPSREAPPGREPVCLCEAEWVRSSSDSLEIQQDVIFPDVINRPALFGRNEVAVMMMSVWAPPAPSLSALL